MPTQEEMIKIIYDNLQPVNMVCKTDREQIDAFKKEFAADNLKRLTKQKR